MTSQRAMVEASLNRPDYADRCAIPRRPMPAPVAAALFLNAAASAGVRAPSLPPSFSVNRSANSY